MPPTEPPASPEFAAVYGRNADLSTAELHAIAGARDLEIAPLNQYAAIVRAPNLDFAELLGGTTKLIELQPNVVDSAEAAIAHLVGAVSSDKRVLFGISSYGSVPATPLTNLARQYLAKRGIKDRYLAKRDGKSGRHPDGELSAVQVKHNKLLTKGHDWCVFETEAGWRFGRTVWVYDFHGFSVRDYEKPAANSKRGMLPPQLARVMVNLGTCGKPGQKVYDPFCGSGVALMEAHVLGHEVVGSDISSAAIKDTIWNLQWLVRRRPDMRFEVTVADATKELPVTAESGVDAIVTEGYLGEPVRAQMTEADLEQEAVAVEKLMVAFFQQARSALPADGRLVITFPIWKLKKGVRRLATTKMIDRLLALGYNKVRPLPGLESTLESILVSRAQQRVIHELFIFQKH